MPLCYFKHRLKSLLQCLLNNLCLKPNKPFIKVFLFFLILDGLTSPADIEIKLE